MAELDIAALTRPLSEANPCGEDLDAAEDDQYMNVMVTAETILPPDYIVVDYKGVRQPFDQDGRYQTLDLGALIKSALPFTERTHDLRVLVLLAKLLILSKDIAGFGRVVEAMAVLLETAWDAVHPHAEEGDLSVRTETLQRLDEPLIVTALQHTPLFVSKRLGPITFQRYLAELKQEGVEEAQRDTSALDKVLADDNQADLATLIGIRETLIAARETVERLRSALERVRAVCAERMDYRAPKILALPLLAGKLCALVARVYALTEGAIVRLDPSAGLEPIADASPQDEAPAPREPVGEVTSGPRSSPGALADARAAGRALAAATAYFRTFEPSNPALLLLGQAQALIGKSFLEAMQLLVPEQVQKAVLGLGTGLVFTLPLVRLAETLPAPSEPLPDGDPESAPPQAAESRSAAVALLDQVGAFYRSAEPSSPIPLLTDRARGLAGKDFAALLADLLPKDAAGTKPK